MREAGHTRHGMRAAPDAGLVRHADVRGSPVTAPPRPAARGTGCLFPCVRFGAGRPGPYLTNGNTHGMRAGRGRDVAAG
jgi:hypothetical protein